LLVDNNILTKTSCLFQ